MHAKSALGSVCMCVWVRACVRACVGCLEWIHVRNLANKFVGREAKSTMGISNFNLWKIQVRKMWKILLNQSLTFKSLPVTWCTNSLTFNNCTFCPHCIYVFCIYMRTNSDLCHLQHKLIGFYNRVEKCLLCGTNWVFKYSGLRFVFKGLNDLKGSRCCKFLRELPKTSIVFVVM